MNIRAYAFLAGYLNKEANQPVRNKLMAKRTRPAIKPKGSDAAAAAGVEEPPWISAEPKFTKPLPGPKRTPEEDRKYVEEGVERNKE